MYEISEIEYFLIIRLVIFIVFKEIQIRAKIKRIPKEMPTSRSLQKVFTCKNTQKYTKYMKNIGNEISFIIDSFTRDSLFLIIFREIGICAKIRWNGIPTKISFRRFTQLVKTRNSA